MKLRSLFIALFAAVCASWAAPAMAGTIYTLTGSAQADRFQLDPNTQQVLNASGFTGNVTLNFVGNGPVVNFQGLALLVPISSATFLPQGGNVANILLPASSYFGVGMGPYLGQGGFGVYDSLIPNFDTYIDFSGPGLNNYDGLSSLAPVAVTMDFLDTFRTTRQGNLVEWHLFNLSNFKFSATTDVPEPATLALFGAGIAGVAAMRRRKKQG